MRFFLTLVLSTILMTGLSIGSAEAKYSLCNKTSYTLSAALGFVDGGQTCDNAAGGAYGRDNAKSC